ncbi:hypothetical protein AVEN_118237-1 [Araneus ventricosus]|uniref:Uncharacterized protein n=1 Tax=Araneus ventricosus TaxID=182803 RepID=A0A4Y2HVC7_ARAVE|nr:hypothetical protein AVEN_118237-1 [Araneus ventricosus]
MRRRPIKKLTAHPKQCLAMAKKIAPKKIGKKIVCTLNSRFTPNCYKCATDLASLCYILSCLGLGKSDLHENSSTVLDFFRVNDLMMDFAWFSLDVSEIGNNSLNAVTLSQRFITFLVMRPTCCVKKYF